MNAQLSGVYKYSNAYLFIGSVHETWNSLHKIVLNSLFQSDSFVLESGDTSSLFCWNVGAGFGMQVCNEYHSAQMASLQKSFLCKEATHA